MLKAIVRLVFIAVSAILWIILAVIGLRSLGQKQEFADWPHRLKNHPWQIEAGPHDCANLKASDDDSKRYRFKWLEVSVDPNGHWVAGSSKRPLTECLKENSDVRLVLNFTAPPHVPVEAAVETIKSAADEEHVILASPFQKVLSKLREDLPQYLTSTSTAELAKARFLTGLFLEPLITVEADLVLLPREIPRLIKELKRRHKIILIRSDDAFVPPSAQ